jgi:hypothetical protein
MSELVSSQLPETRYHLLASKLAAELVFQQG